MNKICTSLEQSKKLLELGIDVNTADMFYNEEQDESYPKDIIDTKYPMVIREGQKHYLEEYGTPAWSFGALLKLIPNWQMQTQDNGIGILLECKECIKIIDADTPIDAAFEMVIWLKENGKI